MNKAITELVRDANRYITPADRHAILDLIEQQAARIAEIEADRDAMMSALAECRDAMPIPEAGAPLEGHWISAIGDPLEVPGYVKACVSASVAPAVDAQPVAWRHKATKILRNDSIAKGADFEPADWEPLYTAAQSEGLRKDALDALRAAEDALESCYDVTEFPCSGKSKQDVALETVRAALSQQDPQ